MKKYLAAILMTVTPAHGTCVLNDGKEAEDSVRQECIKIYSQARFDGLKDKDRAITNCTVSRSYYKKSDTHG